MRNSVELKPTNIWTSLQKLWKVRTARGGLAKVRSLDWKEILKTEPTHVKANAGMAHLAVVRG